MVIRSGARLGDPCVERSRILKLEVHEDWTVIQARFDLDAVVRILSSIPPITWLPPRKSKFIFTPKISDPSRIHL